MSEQQKPKEEPRVCSRLETVTFVNSVAFAGESTSCRIARDANGVYGTTGVVDAILPARLEADGTPTAIDKGQLATGVLLRKKRNNEIRQAFVPFSNVKELQYGP